MYYYRSGLTTNSTLNTGALRGNRRRFGFQLAVLAAVTLFLSGAGGSAWAEPAKPGDKAVATGDHWKITESELDQQAKPQIDLLENMMKQARARALNAMIDSRVLEEAAKAEKVTPDQLLKREVDSKVPLPSDAEAKGFYDQHKNLFSAPYEKVSDKLKKMLQIREISKRRVAFVADLRKKENVKADILMPSGSSVGQRPGGTLGLQELLRNRIPDAGNH